VAQFGATFRVFISGAARPIRQPQRLRQAPFWIFGSRRTTSPVLRFASTE
jgi:hypothetical protein